MRRARFSPASSRRSPKIGHGDIKKGARNFHTGSFLLALLRMTEMGRSADASLINPESGESFFRHRLSRGKARLLALCPSRGSGSRPMLRGAPRYRGCAVCRHCLMNHIECLSPEKSVLWKSNSAFHRWHESVLFTLAKASRHRCFFKKVQALMRGQRPVAVCRP